MVESLVEGLNFIVPSLNHQNEEFELIFQGLDNSALEEYSETVLKFAKMATPLFSVPTGPLRAVKIRPMSKLISPKRI